MSALTKVCVVTRGRTGSSAITDELGKLSYARSLLEIFSSTPAEEDGPQEHVDLWRADTASDLAGEALADRYLEVTEQRCRQEGRKAFFFKALSNHFAERPYLGGLLGRRGYLALCLRRNPARQVMSGMIAAQRGKFNATERYVDDRRFVLDVGKYQELVRIEWALATEDYRQLESHCIPYLVVHYEDFLADRAGFFRRIAGFCGLPAEVPSTSDYVVMIDDPQHTVENFDEVRAAAEEIGHPL